MLALDPNHGEALVGLARLLELEGETSQAIVRLEVICESQPKLGAAWLLRACLLLEEGGGPTARSCCERAVELDRALADDELPEAILEKGGRWCADVWSAGVREDFVSQGNGG